MDVSTFSKLLDSIRPHYESVNIIWHGGEPTLAGIKFFRETQRKVDDYSSDLQIHQAIQTNGTLIDEEMAVFFKNNGFGVGISFDGFNNDLMRGKTKECLRGVQLLRDQGLEPGAICVVNKHNITNLKNEYEYFKKLKFKSVRFNAYIPINNKSIDAYNQIGAEEALNNYKDLFDYWCSDLEPIRVDPFITHINLIKEHGSRLCEHASCLQDWLCMDAEGMLGPCDREFPSEFMYDNINNITDIRQIYSTQGFQSLIKKSIERRNKCKEDCELYNKCLGGCNSKALSTGDISNRPKDVCTFFKSLYRFIESKDNAIIESQLMKLKPYEK